MDVDFAQWYTDIVKKAEMADYSSVKGCIIMRPYALSLIHIYELPPPSEASAAKKARRMRLRYFLRTRARFAWRA